MKVDLEPLSQCLHSCSTRVIYLHHKLTRGVGMHRYCATFEQIRSVCEMQSQLLGSKNRVDKLVEVRLVKGVAALLQLQINLS